MEDAIEDTVRLPTVISASTEEDTVVVVKGATDEEDMKVGRELENATEETIGMGGELVATEKNLVGTGLPVTDATESVVTMKEVVTVDAAEMTFSMGRELTVGTKDIAPDAKDVINAVDRKLAVADSIEDTGILGREPNTVDTTKGCVGME